MRFSRFLLLAAAAISMSGCATKGYVNDSVAGAETRQKGYTDESIAGLEARQNARMDGIEQTSREALTRAIAAGKLAEGKFLYDVVLSDDAVKFASGRSELSADAQSRIAALASKLKAENGNVYLEIQGHTDSTGPASSNEKLGLERAEAVRRLLNQQGVALNRMATISYGEEAPVASNSTRQGRAANRRVVIVVLK